VTISGYPAIRENQRKKVNFTLWKISGKKSGTLAKNTGIFQKKDKYSNLLISKKR